MILLIFSANINNSIWFKLLEMMLIDCEINVILTLSENCFFVQAITAIQVQTFSITDTKHYVPIVT